MSIFCIQHTRSTEKNIFLSGLFVGLSLANGGPGLACLAKTIYNYLCYGLQKRTYVHEEDIACDEAKGQLQQVASYSTLSY